jgi:hypothetical protein
MTTHPNPDSHVPFPFQFPSNDPTILPMASLASKGYPPNSLHDSRDRATDLLPLQVRASK